MASEDALIRLLFDGSDIDVLTLPCDIRHKLYEACKRVSAAEMREWKLANDNLKKENRVLAYKNAELTDSLKSRESEISLLKKTLESRNTEIDSLQSEVSAHQSAMSDCTEMDRIIISHIKAMREHGIKPTVLDLKRGTGRSTNLYRTAIKQLERLKADPLMRMEIYSPEHGDERSKLTNLLDRDGLLRRVMFVNHIPLDFSWFRHCRQGCDPKKTIILIDHCLIEKIPDFKRMLLEWSRYDYETLDNSI